MVSDHHYGGHAVRGNSESLIEAVHGLGGVQYSATEHTDRARHTQETYEKHYKRTPHERVLQIMRDIGAAKARLFTADDVLFL